MTETTASGIVKWTNSDPASIVQQSQQQGDSVELALSKRERFDFVWANAAERTAQTGMVQGSRGYQVDNRSEYIYNSSAWRLATPHAEFTASKSVPGGSVQGLGVFTVDTSASTDTTFVTPGTDGNITFVNPGIYALTALTNTSVLMGGASTFAIRETVSLDTIATVTVPTGQNVFYNSIANVRITVSNFQLQFIIFQATASTTTTRARVTRIG